MMVVYHQDLLGSPTEINVDLMVNKVSTLFQDQMPDDMKARMQQDVTDQEIQLPLFYLGNERAPGLDCFTALLLKKSWHIVKDDVIAAIKSFFMTGKAVERGEFDYPFIDP